MPVNNLHIIITAKCICMDNRNTILQLEYLISGKSKIYERKKHNIIYVIICYTNILRFFTQNVLRFGKLGTYKSKQIFYFSTDQCLLLFPLQPCQFALKCRIQKYQIKKVSENFTRKKGQHFKTYNIALARTGLFYKQLTTRLRNQNYIDTLFYVLNDTQKHKMMFQKHSPIQQSFLLLKLSLSLDPSLKPQPAASAWKASYPFLSQQE